ncbi:hypothetical protein LC605_26500 [Nostoc sp. CHAB 5836]|uniref:hypothetical protein n=1 Tax=Nostoc sp. CHAB 5836 TaxID=2780404 RepID=UPI001E3C1D5E|nr:hypothetical protein [Nostoc sp. CHAB 5836]MCC5618574.1 hypothetical protein [Nostoc sp. CHAB 5836]
MNDEIGIIGIRSESLCFDSDYIPFIHFTKQVQKDAVEKYILEEVENFFKTILKINVPATQIPYHKTIAKSDFMAIDISYFYENIFYDLGDRGEDGKLKPKIKWGITFDEECVPIRVANAFKAGLEEKIGYFDRRPGRPYLQYRSYNRYPPYRQYGTIDINGTPIFYYLQFTLQEILDVIKELPKS